MKTLLTPILALTTSALLILNVWQIQSTWFGVPLFLIYLFLLADQTGKKFFGQESRLDATLLGLLALVLSLALAGTGFYYTTGITPISTSILVLLPLFLFWNTPDSLVASKPKKEKGVSLGTIAVLVLQGALFFLLVRAQTDTTLVSPWHNLSPWFFVLYTLSTAGIFLMAPKQRFLLTYILIGVQLLITWNVATIIYTLGFGFDGFIHRAAESWILENGVILPKTPFYIGQYSLVVVAAMVTGVSIFSLDSYLVPVLASIFLPFLFAWTGQKIWGWSKEKTILFVFVVPWLYFLNFNVTTPHNLVLILSILAIFTLLAFLKNTISFLLPALLTLSAMATHPLLGAPLLVFATTVLLVSKVRSQRFRISLMVGMTFTIILLPSLMFGVNNFLQGYGLPELINPGQQLNSFVSLFKRPFWYQNQAPFLFDLLYSWQALVPILAITLGTAGVWRHTKADRSVLIFPLGAISFFLSAFVLHSMIVFPGVASSEQGNYPLRLISSSILFLLPFLIVEMFVWYEWSKGIIKKYCPQRQRVADITLIIGVSSILTLSLYFAYPQSNPKVRFPGFNVTEADFQAVRLIEAKAGEDYIVLSNILVGAAALTEYSFSKHYQTTHGELFYYSIPSGGILYDFFSQMVYEGQKREYMESAMRLTGTKKAYFVMNSYWAHAHKIIREATKTADKVYTAGDDNEVTILEYQLTPVDRQ